MGYIMNYHEYSRADNPISPMAPDKIATFHALSPLPAGKHKKIMPPKATTAKMTSVVAVIRSIGLLINFIEEGYLKL
jgi:hypothetical protein